MLDKHKANLTQLIHLIALVLLGPGPSENIFFLEICKELDRTEMRDREDETKRMLDPVPHPKTPRMFEN